jgi:integrase
LEISAGEMQRTCLVGNGKIARCKTAIQKRRNRSHSRELRLLKAVFSWAEQQEPPLISRNAVSRFKLPRISDKEIPVPPTADEIKSILRVAEPHLVRAIMIFWFTGVRPGKELCAIRWSDVDLAGNTMRVTSARKGGPVSRFVPLSDDLVRRMNRWFQEDLKRKEDVSDLAITHFRLKPVLSLKRSWNTAKERAGIHRKLRLYDLRHAMISNALRRGADLKAVSEVVGHSRPDTTLREYQHIVKEQHREVVNVIPELDDDDGLEGIGA